jgi:hypothetical protein
MPLAFRLGALMSETIILDSTNREVVRGIVKDSSVVCSDTSAHDVYVHVITKADTAELYKGDGTVIPKMTRTRFYVFRRNPGAEPFSATVVVTDLPADKEKMSNVLMTAFSLVKHKPNAMKIPKAKKAAKKAFARAPKRKAPKKRS